MTLPRLVQNFSGNRALLVGIADPTAATLETVLGRLGLCAERIAPNEAALEQAAASIQADGDVIIVDGDTDIPGYAPLGRSGQIPGAPVVALVGVEAPGRLRALLALGATAFIRKPVQQSGVYSALFLGINQYRMRRHLTELIADHEQRRRGRRGLVKAILALVDCGMNDDAAYELLRREAMRERLSVEAYSEAFIGRLEEAASETGSPAAPVPASSKRHL
jgi:AmiR/NasT family two-component response regulator